jgi:hypothetical protein
MAQAKKKRRRKHRGTQGGRVDNNRRPKARPRSREEAKARARARGKRVPRADTPPTWGSAVFRGAIAAVIFFVLLLALFGRPLGSALALAGFMLVFYIPAGYYFDTMMWRRRERARIRAAEKP